MSPLLRNRVIVSLAFGSLCFSGCEQAENPSEATQGSAAASPTPTSTQKSATANSFDEVTAQLDPGGDFYLYLSTAQWLGKLSESIDSLRELLLSSSPGQSPQDQQEAEKGFALLQDMVRKSGLEEITGIGASSFALTPGLHRNKLFAHHYPDKGTGLIWALYGKTAHPLGGLDLLPVDTGAAAFGDFDLALLVDFLRQEALQSGIPNLVKGVSQAQTQFAGVTGLKLDDVLQSLNGSMGMVVTLDSTSTLTVTSGTETRTIPQPRGAVMIAVKNDLIFNRIDQLLGANPGVTKVDQPDFRMRSMSLPFPLAIKVLPTIAQWNGYFILATDTKIVNDIIAVHKGAPGYTSTPEYAELSAGLPKEGNSFFVQSERFVDMIHQYQADEATTSLNGAGGPQNAFLKHILSDQSKKSGRGMAVGGLLQDGWLTVSQGSQGASQMFAPLLIIPVAAVSAIPSLSMAGFLNSGMHSGTQMPSIPPPSNVPSPTPSPVPAPSSQPATTPTPAP